MKMLEKVKTSYDLFMLINEHRVSNGIEPMKHHRDLMVKINDEIGEGEVCAKKRTVHKGIGQGSRSFEVIELTRKDVYIVAMRESKEVRSSIYDYLEAMEEGIAAIKDIMWEVINGQAYVSQEQALKSVGVKHPRLFIKFLKSNKAFYNSVVFERQLLSERQCNKHGDRWLKFTKAGFQWLIDEKVKIDLWVEEQKVIQKNAGKLPC